MHLGLSKYFQISDTQSLVTGAQAVLCAPVSVALLPNISAPKRKLPSMVQSRAATAPYRFRGGQGNGPRKKYYKELSVLRDTFADFGNLFRKANGR